MTCVLRKLLVIRGQIKKWQNEVMEGIRKKARRTKDNVSSDSESLLPVCSCHSSPLDLSQASPFVEYLKTVPDNDIPAMVFLLNDFQEVVNLVQPVKSVTDLFEVFKIAVKEKSMNKVREHLRMYTMLVWQECHSKLQNEESISLATDFSGEDDVLDKSEEAILRVNEVLQLFSCFVPEIFQDALRKICREKRIPEKTDDGKMRQVFVYSENKTLRKICDTLDEEAVCQMYEKLRNQNNKLRVTPSTEDLKLLEISSSDMKTTKGLKETSFYCFVLALVKESLFNRVHTHNLCEYLEDRDIIHVPSHAICELQLYPLKSKPPGICIIFNMELDRQGSEHDFKTVESLFKETFKYDVFSIKNPKKAAVLTTIEKLKANKNQFYDSLVVVFMSHGTETCLKVADGELHRRVDLIDPITKIEWLAKKPKLFFQQACACKYDAATEQGCKQSGLHSDKASDKGLSNQTGHNAVEMYKHFVELEGLHPFADTLISYATKWYDSAARCTDTGSPYINILVDQLKRFGTTEPIEEVLRRVHYETNMLKMKVKNVVEPHRQAPYFESSLQKVFMFPSQ